MVISEDAGRSPLAPSPPPTPVPPSDTPLDYTMEAPRLANPSEEPTGTTATSTPTETQTSPEDAYISVEEEMNYDDEVDEAFLISGDQNAGDDINIGEEFFDEMFEETTEDSGF
eukprot:scaffold136596_cov35-Attheya_sp.AAC.1